MQIKVCNLVKNSNGDIMSREIDLKNFAIRTDLISEISSQFKKEEKKEEDGITVTKVLLDKEEAKLFSKKEGTYITIEFEDITDTNNFLHVKKILKEELKVFLKGKENILLVGLGNPDSTPDVLGPNVMDEIVVTSYLEEFGPLEEGFSKTAIFKPGVTGQTGIETSCLLKSVVDVYKPDRVIVIDALASKSLSRVCKTIQISDTGIAPGSGVGNKRKEISFKTLGVPVLAIGIPTVVDAVSVVADTIGYLEKEYSFQKNFMKSKKSRFVHPNSVNYLKEEVDIKKEDKEALLGMVGTLEEEEVKKLLYEVLTPIGYNLMVTPKEIDFVIKKLTNLLSSALNETIHPKLDQAN
jgi:spore protease